MKKEKTGEMDRYEESYKRKREEKKKREKGKEKTRKGETRVAQREASLIPGYANEIIIPYESTLLRGV